jgi:hypothetical protein
VGVLMRAPSRQVSVHGLQPTFRTIIVDEIDVGKVSCEEPSRREVFKRITRLIAHILAEENQERQRCRETGPKLRRCKLVHSGVHLHHGNR